MRMVCVDGLPVSLAKVVGGQVGIQLQPTSKEHLDICKDIRTALIETGRVVCSDRLGDHVIYIANFRDIDEAVNFFRQLEYETKLLLRDEFSLVWKSLW